MQRPHTTVMRATTDEGVNDRGSMTGRQGRGGKNAGERAASGATMGAAADAGGARAGLQPWHLLNRYRRRRRSQKRGKLDHLHLGEVAEERLHGSTARLVVGNSQATREGCWRSSCDVGFRDRCE